MESEPKYLLDEDIIKYIKKSAYDKFSEEKFIQRIEEIKKAIKRAEEIEKHAEAIKRQQGKNNE